MRVLYNGRHDMTCIVAADAAPQPTTIPGARIDKVVDYMLLVAACHCELVPLRRLLV